MLLYFELQSHKADRMTKDFYYFQTTIWCWSKRAQCCPTLERKKKNIQSRTCILLVRFECDYSPRKLSVQPFNETASKRVLVCVILMSRMWKSLEVKGAECEQQSCVVRAGFQNNLSATVSDRGTSKSCYCCGCQTEIRDSKPIPLSDIYLFLQLLDWNPNKHH